MKIDLNKIKEYIFSIKIEKAILLVGIILLLIISFLFGMFVGFEKASFSYRTGEKYFLEMNGRGGDPMMGFRREDFQNTHGTTGKIIKISPDSVVVIDRDQKERVVSVSTTTLIKKFRDDIKINDLKTDDFITVIGSPNESGSVSAKLIRVMPDPNNISNPLPEIK